MGAGIVMGMRPADWLTSASLVAGGLALLQGLLAMDRGDDVRGFLWFSIGSIVSWAAALATRRMIRA
jgi:hypothetical protein